MIEAFDVNRRYPEIGNRVLRSLRESGGRAAAAVRHEKLIERKVQLRVEYDTLRRAGWKSKDAIKMLAKKHGLSIPYMRRSIRPRSGPL